MYIAIDSSNQHRYTGMVSGGLENLYDFYEELERIFSKTHIHPPFHWSDITRKNRNKCRKQIENLVNKSQINFNIFIHKPSLLIPKKRIFLELLPIAISQNLDGWLKKISGIVIFEVDDDFNFKGCSTNHFISQTLKRIIPTLCDKPIKIIQINNGVKATIKQKKGVVDLSFRITDIKNSKGIQIVDIVMGYFLQRTCKFKKNRLFVRKVC